MTLTLPGRVESQSLMPHASFYASPRAEGVLDAVLLAGRHLLSDLERIGERTDAFQHEPLAAALVASAASRCVQRCAATGVQGEATIRPLSEALWSVVGELLSQSWLLRRAREKPRGYAGDYALMARICEPAPSETPLGRAIDAFFLSQSAALAVATRTDDLAAAIVAERCHNDGPFSIVSVGSGAGLDIARALASLRPEDREDLSVTLLDYDPEGLEFARRRLEPLVESGALIVVRENLARLAQPRRAESLPDCDLLICPGLFDYLADDLAASLLELFHRRLRAGGVALVGNFAPHCPSRAFMEWIGDWHLTYRESEELLRLARRAGLAPGRANVLSERMGVDLFLELRRGADFP